MKKRLLTIILTLTMIMTLIPAFGIVAYASNEFGDIEYLKPCYEVESDPTKGITGMDNDTCTSYTAITSGSDSAFTLNEGWYVVSGTSIDFTKGLIVSGDVHLILANNCNITVTADSEKAGISVSSPSSLTIYAQSFDFETMGQLTVTGGAWAAGIGGGFCGNGENIIINGGYITVTGGNNGGPAGIGGGHCGNGENIIINGGIVNTTAGNKDIGAGAGIGGGYKGHGENILINSGTVNAIGGNGGAGIGGGSIAEGLGGYGKYITINGGTVNTTGGAFAAGIGGGSNGNGEHITINGGIVTAKSVKNGGNSGIGGGHGGNGISISINGGTVHATGVNGGAGIGGGYLGYGKYITISGINTSVTAICEDGNGAGIGGGFCGYGEYIYISGGIITAKGGNANNPAAIGGGHEGYGENIFISGGTVNAIGGTYGTGIGGGCTKDGKNIYITGGTVYASGGSGEYGTGIGGGTQGNGININISCATVTAIGGNIGGAGIGGGRYKHAENITISGINTSVTAIAYNGADGIGNGNSGSGSNNFYVTTDLAIRADNNNTQTTFIQHNNLTSDFQSKQYVNIHAAHAVVDADNNGVFDIDNDTNCFTLQDAINTALDNESVKLIDDAVVTTALTINKSITLNLDNHLLKGNTDYIISNSGIIAIKDGTISGGAIYTEGNTTISGVQIKGSTNRGVYAKNCTVTIDGNTNITGNTKDGNACNLYLDAQGCIALGSNFTGTIGVSCSSGTGIVSTNGSSEYSNKIKSDNDIYKLSFSGTQFKLENYTVSTLTAITTNIRPEKADMTLAQAISIAENKFPHMSLASGSTYNILYANGSDGKYKVITSFNQGEWSGSNELTLESCIQNLNNQNYYVIGVIEEGPTVSITTSSIWFKKGETVKIEGTITDNLGNGLNTNSPFILEGTSPVAICANKVGSTNKYTWSYIYNGVDVKDKGLTFTATDANSKTGSAKYTLNVDTLAPVITITPSINAYVVSGSNVNWYKKGTSVSISANVTDETSGINKITKDGISYSAGTSVALDTSTEMNTTSIISFEAIDNAGNSTSTSFSYNVDGTAPVITDNSPNTTSPAAKVIFKLTATDTSGSGVKEAKYSIDNGAKQTYTIGSEITIDYNCKLSFYFYDNVGNISTKEYVITNLASIPASITNPIARETARKAITAINDLIIEQKGFNGDGSKAAESQSISNVLGETGYVDMMLKSVGLNEDTANAKVTTFTFNLTPYNSDKEEQHTLSDDITFKLPLYNPNNFNTANVYHGNELIQTVSLGAINYIETSSQNFSEYSYTLSNVKNDNDNKDNKDDKDDKDDNTDNIGSNSSVDISKIKEEETTIINFVDVNKYAYYYDAVVWASQNGITTGIDSLHFEPFSNCSRAQILTFLWRAAGSPEPKTTTSQFYDIYPQAYYYKAVLWATENNITKGTSDTTFSPNAEVTRGQTVTFIARLNGSNETKVGNAAGFTDVKASDYYYNAVSWAASNGITTGITETTFAPKEICTRSQIVTFIYRYFVK